MAVAIKMDITYFPDNEPPDFAAVPRHLGSGGLPQRGPTWSGVEPTPAGAAYLESELDSEYPDNQAVAP